MTENLDAFDVERPSLVKSLGRIPLSVWTLAVALVVTAALATVLLGTPGSGKALGAAADVTVTGQGFEPAEITVPLGATVTWTDTDTSGHWVASDPFPTDTGLASLNSRQALHQSDTYSYTFTQRGKFTYHDQLKPYTFKGTVTVR